MNETLKPCPFCGGEATVERIGVSGYYYVACNTAYCCDFGKFDTESEAIAAWNTRADYHGYEQAAIEAWESIKAWNTRAELGSERIAELEAENERLRKAGYEIGYHDAMKAAKRGGTLTAEQVSKATYAHSIHADCADADWQAIADELNAELGSGTCENSAKEWGEKTYYFVCSECGWNLANVGRASIELAAEMIKTCPNCGKRVSA